MRRLASWIQATVPAWGRSILSLARRWLVNPVLSLESAIAEAARGIYTRCSPLGSGNVLPEALFDGRGVLSVCNCSGRYSRPASRKRVIGLTRIAGDKYLLLHSDPLAQALGRSTSPIQTPPVVLWLAVAALSPRLRRATNRCERYRPCTRGGSLTPCNCSCSHKGAAESCGRPRYGTVAFPPALHRPTLVHHTHQPHANRQCTLSRE